MPRYAYGITRTFVVCSYYFEALPGVYRICITEAFLQQEADAEVFLQRLVLLNVAVLRDAAPAPEAA